MGKPWKKYIIRGLLGVGAAALVAGGVWWYQDQRYFASLVDEPSDVKKWEADPRPLQKESVVVKEIEKINKENKEQDVSLKSMQTIVIPGLRGAWSIDHKTKEAAFGTDWVPQGVTQSEDYFYISAYDGDHKLNSLIFQVNKKSRKYVKSLILSSKAHVGGIVFDRQHQHLIYSNDNKYGAGFGVITKADIDAYQASEQQKPIKAKKIYWPFGSRTSALTIYDDQMVIAKYGKKSGDRSIFAMPLTKEGLPQEPSDAEIQKIVKAMDQEGIDKMDPKSYAKILIKEGILNSYNPGWDRLQGIAISKEGITLLSQSNGNAPGKIWVQIPTSGNTWSKLKFVPPTEGASELAVPAAVEEVSINPEETYIAMIFESGAKKYRESGLFFHRKPFMDRIMILPIKIYGTADGQTDVQD